MDSRYRPHTPSTLRTVRSFGAQLGSTLPEERGSSPLFVRASFEVRCETDWGESVAVVGSTAQLGAWRPEAGMRMTTNQRIYPSWRSEPLLLSEVLELEYKFVVIGPDGNAVRWEPLQHNRRLALQSASEVRVVADWGQPSSMPPQSQVDPLSLAPLTGSVLGASSVPAPTAPARAGERGGGCGSSAPDHRQAPREASGIAPAVDMTVDLPAGRLLVVQQHLPFNVAQAEDGSWGGEWDEWDLLATNTQGGRHMMGSLNVEVLFVGCVRTRVPPEAQAAVAEMLAVYNCVPVFLSDALYDSHCNGYGPTVLWPILNNQIPDRHAGGKGGDGTHVSSLYNAYVRANDAFAHTIRSVLRVGDMIWVHGYNLTLLPAALRQTKLPAHCTVSFFLHSPCPSPEVWRVIPHRSELLRGMLAGDVVGFHLFEYARHFMTSCRRLLGLGENVGGPTGGGLCINTGSRRVTITVSHVGIDPDVLNARLRLPETAEHEGRLREQCKVGERIVVGGVEMLHPLQGAHIKLLAFQQLLENYPVWRKRLTLLQVCFPDKQRPEQSAQQSAENREVVRRIEEAFGPDTIRYFEVGAELDAKLWTKNTRLALFRAVDVLLNCAMKDGLNLLPFEYIHTKHSQQASGVVVLSEFVGCAHVLNGCVRINPFNLEHVVEQLDAALSMPPSERAARLSKDHSFVASHTTRTWLHVAVQDMRRTAALHASGEASSSRPTLALCSFGSEMRAGQQLPPLNVEALARAYVQSTRRLILLGLDGTLIQQEKVMHHRKMFHDFSDHSLPPPPAALHCLAALASDPCNQVYVISGRSASDLEACLGNVDGLGLGAELGFMQMRPRSGKWLKRELSPAQERWKDTARPIFERFTLRTNGVYMSWQESAAIWCYHNADPDYGRFQARQLTVALKEQLKGTGVSVLHSLSKCQVEVRIGAINKGVFADAALTEAHAGGPVDFVLAIGDDDDDEYMLSAVTARASGPAMLERLRGRLFTVAVGSKDYSHARFVCESSRTVLQLMQTLRDGRDASFRS